MNFLSISTPIAALLLLAVQRAVSLTDDELVQMGFRTGPPKVEDHCADSSNYCREWAVRGECDRNPRYMLQACRESCQRCIPKHEALFLKDSRQIRLHTEYGTMAINIYRTAAPHTTYKLLRLAQRGLRGCTRCKFYRAEGNKTYESGFQGQGLLQGSFTSLNDAPTLEGNLGVRRGHVALIPNTREFFIALRDHPEFGLAHTVFGEVDAVSLEVAEAIVGQPGKEFEHPIYGTTMRILKTDVTFTMDSFKPGAPSAADIRKGENIARRRAARLNITMAELAVNGPFDDLVEMGVNLTKLVQEEELAKYPAELAAAVAAEEDAKLEAESGVGAGEGEEEGGDEEDTAEEDVESEEGVETSKGREGDPKLKEVQEDAVKLMDYDSKDLIPLDSKHEIAGIYTPREDVIPMDA